MLFSIFISTFAEILRLTVSGIR